MTIPEITAKRLITLKKTLSLAESCTGGLVSHWLTNIPKSSCFLKCTIVAYANEAKIKLLSVSKNDLKEYGAVSSQVARAMAKGALNLFKTDYSISITGIAGPSGSTKTKPLGLTFIAVATKKKIVVKKFIFRGTRQEIKKQAGFQALKILNALLP